MTSNRAVRHYSAIEQHPFVLTNKIFRKISREIKVNCFDFLPQRTYEVTRRKSWNLNEWPLKKRQKQSLCDPQAKCWLVLRQWAVFYLHWFDERFSMSGKIFWKMLKFARQTHHCRSSSVDRSVFISNSPKLSTKRSSSVERTPVKSNQIEIAPKKPVKSKEIEIAPKKPVKSLENNEITAVPVARLVSPPPPVPSRHQSNSSSNNNDEPGKSNSDYEAISTLCLLPGNLCKNHVWLKY